MKISGRRFNLALNNGCDLRGFRVFRHIRCFTRLTLERCQPLGFCADIAVINSDLIGRFAVSTIASVGTVTTVLTVCSMQRCKPLGFRADIPMLESNLISGLAVSAVARFFNLLQKLRIQIRRRRNRRFIIAHKAGGTDIQCHRNSRCTNCRIAFGIVTEHGHFRRTDMKLRRQVQRCAVSAEDDIVCLVALCELDDLMESPPVSVKSESELHILDLMIRQHLTFQNLNALVLYKEFPHYSSPTFHS